MLILSTLGFSSAWAFDSHVLDQLDVVSDSLDTASDNLRGDNLPDDHSNVDIACDHCGHISSHLIAIFSDSGSTATESTTIYTSSMSEGLNSYIPGPDRKPPRY